jgi:CHAT domain-containing protein
MSIERAAAVAAMVSLTLAGCSCDGRAAPERDAEADRLYESGRSLMDKRRYEEARRDLGSALRRHREIGDHGGASADAQLLSRTYWLVSDYPAAFRWAKDAQTEAAATGQEAVAARTLLWIGNLLQSAGDDARALEAYKQAEPHLPADDKESRARMGFYRALHLRRVGRLPMAEQLLQDARKLAREAGAHRLSQAATIDLASFALAERRLDGAASYLREAREAGRAAGDSKPRPMILVNESELARESGDLAAATAALDQAAAGADPETALTIEHHRGLIAEAAGRLDEAERAYRNAIAIIERLREEAAPEDAKASFFEHHWSSYEDLFALQLRRGDARQAFATLVQVQGRMFLDTLSSSADRVGAPGPLLDGAMARIGALEQLVVPALSRSPLGQPVAPDDVLAALRDRHVLVYFAGGGRLRLLEIVDGEPRITSVDVELRQLDRLVADFTAHLDDENAAAALGKALVPLDVLPASRARIDVVPTGPLLRVPFAALVVAGERILERHEVAYAPSITGLAAVANRRHGGAGPGVVLADARRDLGQAEFEMHVVVDNTKAQGHLGPEATIAAFKAAADASLLHVISHSDLGPSGGYLELADGEVTAADILAWRIRPRLVVLPTCGSAATHRQEMWDSLAAAFLAAGSEHVVATLASVLDRDAAEFTRLFYRAGGIRDPVAAAALAQREMALHLGVAAWSAFIVAGL